MFWENKRLYLIEGVYLKEIDVETCQNNNKTLKVLNTKQ